MPVYELQEAAEGSLEEFAEIPVDTKVTARLTAIKEETKPFKDDDGNDIKRLQWTFVVTDGEYNNRKIFGDTGVKFVEHPECKLYAWAGSLLGTELPKGFRLNTDDLIGLRADLRVGQKRYTKKGASKETVLPIVEDIFPLSTSGAVGHNDPF